VLVVLFARRGVLGLLQRLTAGKSTGTDQHG